MASWVFFIGNYLHPTVVEVPSQHDGKNGITSKQTRNGGVIIGRCLCQKQKNSKYDQEVGLVALNYS